MKPARLQSHHAIPLKDIQLGQVIGEGGYGKVYQAEWHYNLVAVKQLLADSLTEASLAEFQHETDLMASLRHPNMVQLFGVCVEHTPYWIVMEYCAQGSLYQVIQHRAAFDWGLRIRIASDIAKGLNYLHAQNQPILHRDLKSLNVLLDKDFKAKLTDFGLATVKQQSSTYSKTDSLVGSVLWMAPELFQRKPKYTVQSDMYSYAIVCWELASWQRPWPEAPNPAVVPTWVMQGERDEIPAQTPWVFKALI